MGLEETNDSDFVEIELDPFYSDKLILLNILKAIRDIRESVEKMQGDVDRIEQDFDYYARTKS